MFFGSGGFSLAIMFKYPNSKFILSEKDRSIRAILEILHHGNRSLLLENVVKIRDFVYEHPVTGWQDVLNWLRNSNYTYELAASKLIFQRIGHGCVARTSKNGIGNVILSEQKTAGFAEWIPNLPDLSGYDLMIVDDYKKCFPVEGSCVLLDPPYYAPGKTKCYPGHDPNSIRSLAVVYDSLKKCFQAGVKTVYFTHYYLPQIDDYVLTNCEKYGYNCTHTNLGLLNSLKNGTGNHSSGRRTKKKTTEYKDWLWLLQRI